MKASRFFLIALACIGFASCHKTATFTIEANIEGQEGSVVYLEQMGIIRNTFVDSAIVKRGTIRFREARPEYPDLYRMRMDGRSILVAVDSTETISMTIDSTFRHATFEASAKSEDLQRLRESVRTNSLEDHKALAKEIILADPLSIAAYYALYQTQGGQMVFDIYDKADRKFYQAVATSLNAWQPENPRTKAIYAQVLEVLNSERRAVNNAAIQAFIDDSENAFLDITMPDADGVDRSLSDLRGQVVVLSFSTLSMEHSKDYIFEMREIYNALHSKGVQIYEVYPDPNRLAWEDEVRELPWVTVWAENGIYNEVYRTYNVQTLPTLFVLNRSGEIIGRYMDFASLRSGIESSL